MKYCPFCKQWNIGKPSRCRFCGRTWQVKICSAGHINPVGANFCGECGRSNLSETSGASPVIFRILKGFKPIVLIVLFILGIAFILGLFQAQAIEGLVTLIITIALLFYALKYVRRENKGTGASSPSILIRKLFNSIQRRPSNRRE